MKVLDWLADMLGLPAHFKFSEPGPGGGVIHGAASEATLVALLAARARTMSRLKRMSSEGSNESGFDINNNNISSSEITSNEVSSSASAQDGSESRRTAADDPPAAIMERLVGYCSDLAHSSVERSGQLGGVTIKSVQSDDQCRLRGAILRQQILEDKANGYVPFFVVATLGTTSVCTFDDLYEIGLVCQEFDLWLHVDAAYAGNSFICPEYRHFMRGIEVSQ